jgi:hypothetical protein
MSTNGNGEAYKLLPIEGDPSLSEDNGFALIVQQSTTPQDDQVE